MIYAQGSQKSKLFKREQLSFTRKNLNTRRIYLCMYNLESSLLLALNLICVLSVENNCLERSLTYNLDQLLHIIIRENEVQRRDVANQSHA